MITLHTFAGRDGLESVSPFCMKVEVYLKLMNVPYTTVIGGDPRRAPKGKMPFIEQDDGPTVADSSAILEHLEKKLEHPLDGGMSEEERARAHVIKRTLEEGFYFVALWSRWVDDAGWAVMKDHVFEKIPVAVRWAVAPIIRKKIAGSITAQGTGRHLPEEIYEMGKLDIACLSTLLGDGPFFLGERMRTIDITAYSFLANTMKFRVESPLRQLALGKPNLVAFVDRIAARVAEAAASSA